jgi:hypothetical protein
VDQVVEAEELVLKREFEQELVYYPLDVVEVQMSENPDMAMVY